jgi:DNA-directed RNA polymerase subunit H (RpoH/RPB5)
MGVKLDHIILKEDHRSSVFKDMELRRIFGPKIRGTTGSWRMLHYKELHSMHTAY